MDKLLTVTELAEVLGVPVPSIYRWRYQRTAPKGIVVGRHLRFRPADVEAWLAAQADDDARRRPGMRSSSTNS